MAASGSTKDSSSDNKDNRTTYFHYTTRDSAKRIQMSRVIKKSSVTGPNDDAAFGNGVYLTTMSPSQSQEEIARNNYDMSNSNVGNAVASGEHCLS